MIWNEDADPLEQNGWLGEHHGKAVEDSEDDEDLQKVWVSEYCWAACWENKDLLTLATSR